MDRSARRGRVTAFDDRRGLGTVRDGAGAEVGFHCTEIADGTRTIEPGAEVAYRVVPGRLGQWEAATLVTLER